MSEKSTSLDKHSIHLLRELQRDARQTIQQLAQAVGLSPTPCWKRIKDMEASGVIRGYTIQVDPQKVGLDLMVVAEVNLDRHGQAQVAGFEAMVGASPQIVSCLSATGPADYILTVMVQDVQHYERFLHDTIFRWPGVTHVRSSIVLRQVKAQTLLPIHADSAAPPTHRP